MASGLIELAMETRRTYSDLVHRSEFDQLTNAHNRFSFERNLDEQIRLARASAGIFGLIYIDLDDFKQVNDHFGHSTGDLYLKEISQRMRRQLRPGDLLARMGGDEFVVLVCEVRHRRGVEEVVTRLSHCFDEPVAADNGQVAGTASFGLALYPEDGHSRESLLRAADVAMYAVKQVRTGQGA